VIVVNLCEKKSEAVLDSIEPEGIYKYLAIGDFLEGILWLIKLVKPIT
jgi:hypothetical protein